MVKDIQFRDLEILDRFFFSSTLKQTVGVSGPYTKLSESEAEEFATHKVIQVDPHELVKKEKRG